MPPKKTETPRLIDKYGTWDEVYRKTPPSELPWNAGQPDPELVRLIESQAIPVGRAIDIGTGPGHDAIFLAKKGFRVLAVDIASSAVELAKINAKKAGVEVAIDYRVESVLKLSSPGRTATFVNDRVCFEVLDKEDREDRSSGVEIRRCRSKLKALRCLNQAARLDTPPWESQNRRGRHVRLPE